MKNIFKLKKIFLLLAVITLFISGCKDEELLFGADRLFRPIITPVTVSGTWMRLEWDRYKDVSNYELDLSVDTFETIYNSFKTDSAQITIKNLDYDTNYQIRLRAIGDSIISTGDSIKSEYYIFSISTLDYPTQLKTPTSADVIDKSIRVKWNVTALPYSRIDVMVSKDSVYKTVILNETENLAGERIISGLQPATSYIVKIYSGENDYKGKKTFNTVSSQIFEGDVVDLRDYSDEEAKNMITQTFVDSLAILYPNGFNMVLSGGTSYAMPTVNLPVSMNIVTGLSFKGKAMLAVNGGFGITAASNIGKIRFEKIFFTEGTVAGKFKTDGNYGGTYVFNMNQANGNVESMIFEGCDIKYKRGVIRMQTSANINKLTINNCLIDSIGGYGVVNNGNDASYIGDIVVTNSTVLNADKVFVCGKALGIKSIIVEKVTTCYSPNGTGSYLFDYNGNTIPGGLSVKDCLFGVGKTETVNGMRSASTSISFDNCFKTSDLMWTINPTTLLPSYPINDLTDLGKTAAMIFVNPAASNFKVTESTLVNKVGDPRWW